MNKQDDLWNKALHGGLRIKDSAGEVWVSEANHALEPYQIIEQIGFVSGNKRMLVRANLISEKIAPTFEIVDVDE